jgi:hypothetical protein
MTGQVARHRVLGVDLPTLPDIVFHRLLASLK